MTVKLCNSSIQNVLYQTDLLDSKLKLVVANAILPFTSASKECGERDSAFQIFLIWRPSCAADEAHKQKKAPRLWNLNLKFYL